MTQTCANNTSGTEIAALPREPAGLRVAGHGGAVANVWDYGGEGPPLLLCHCTGTLGRVWDPVVARLRDRYRVLAPDTRGHGNSGKPMRREAYAWIDSGRDLLAIIDALDLGTRVRAAGHSGGAAQIAYAEMLRPGVCPRVVLIDAIVGPPIFFKAPRPLAVQARRRRNVFQDRQAARERFAAKPPMASWCAEALDAYVTHGFEERDDGRVQLKCPPQIESWFYEHGGACDVFARLAEVDFEALLVTGSTSNVAHLVDMQLARLPKAQKRVIEGAGHFMPQERPDAVADVLTDWLR